MVLRHVLGCNAGTGFSGRKPPPRGQRSKSECAALTSSFDRNNSYGQASLKRQKSPETTTDIQDVSLLILRVKCSYFEIIIVINRPYFVPQSIP